MTHFSQKDGFINLSKANIAAANGLNGYAIPKLKTRLDYQRPRDEPKIYLR